MNGSALKIIVTVVTAIAIAAIVGLGSRVIDNSSTIVGMQTSRLELEKDIARIEGQVNACQVQSGMITVLQNTAIGVEKSLSSLNDRLDRLVDRLGVIENRLTVLGPRIRPNTNRESEIP